MVGTESISGNDGMSMFTENAICGETGGDHTTFVYPLWTICPVQLMGRYVQGQKAEGGDINIAEVYIFVTACKQKYYQ